VVNTVVIPWSAPWSALWSAPWSRLGFFVNQSKSE
jgi:hypothetical protein